MMLSTDFSSNDLALLLDDDKANEFTAASDTEEVPNEQLLGSKTGVGVLFLWS